jgi:hypothetical protein
LALAEKLTCLMDSDLIFFRQLEYHSITEDGSDRTARELNKPDVEDTRIQSSTAAPNDVTTRCTGRLEGWKVRTLLSPRVRSSEWFIVQELPQGRLLGSRGCASCWHSSASKGFDEAHPSITVFDHWSERQET